ncbi:DEKNAAC100394 [Brettanomyces naardenensis]|uniref:enoyl-[acyl-carrier-protein] reductase n=1 Tax=Brettanomyces naardenensis TaxID=13370 RepID=A0A448YFX0_BRENA|nr:DEKNAAC100394 [Brettanomyces naardenensis]
MSTIRARAIVYSKYGEPIDVIKTHSYDLPAPESLKDDQVLLQTLAAPLNPSDINQIQGVYPSRPPISINSLPGLKEASAVSGNEGVFKVLGAGSAVANLKPGDWVIPHNVNYGTWTSHSLSAEKDLLKIPNTIPLKQAATMAVNTSSAYLMLTHFVDLKKGDWFIQNGGNSQVGRCAIQIAKQKGINSISIVRNRPNLKELVDELTALGATHVITEDDNGSRDFGKTIKEWTDGKSISLGMNCVGGSSVSGLSRKLGKNATLVTYGGMSMKPVTLPTSLFIFKNLKAVGFWITEMTKEDPSLRSEVIEEVLKLIESGSLADIHCTLNKIVNDKVSDEQFTESFKQGLIDSKTKGKQIMIFE